MAGPQRGGRTGGDSAVPGRADQAAGTTGRTGAERRGSGRADVGRIGTGGAGAADRRSGLSEARRYTPRGRTVRESAQERGAVRDVDRRAIRDAQRRAESADAPQRRSARDAARRTGRGDPFRPALEVLEGGRSAPSARATTSRQPTSSTSTRQAAPSSRQATSAASGRQATSARQATTTRQSATSRTATTRQATGRRVPTRGRPVSRTVRPRRRTPSDAPPRIAEPRFRLRLATVLALAMFLLIGGRLVQLQIADARAYAADGLADRLQTIDLPAPRGAILDRDGNILAHSVEANYVFGDPTLVKDPVATADKLFGLLAPYGVTRSELVRKLTPHKGPDGKRDVEFEYLARGVDLADGERVTALGLLGVGVRRDERREVPGNELAANVLGFVGRGDDHSGLAGLEYSYDSVLRGVDGKRVYEIGERDLAKPIPGGYEEEQPARKGTSLRLTLDRDVQYAAQNTLYERLMPQGAYFGSAIVMDAHTGDVIAMASHPSYDAADPGKYPREVRRDICTQIVFDPGSIHKAIIVGAALQEGVITPESTVVVGPRITKGDTTYTDTTPHYKDTPMTIPGVLALSSNVGTIKIADMLGKDKIVEYQRRFGLGERTGVGLPGEAPGALLPPHLWSGSSPGSIPIGNGVATTALQMAAAFGAIANDGVWVQPRLVQATIGPDGRATATPAPKTRRVLDPQHASALRMMLEGVVTLDSGTGKQAAISGYRVAGKTGTAKLPKDGGYADGDVVSFIGMAPADAPRYVVAVTAHVPKGAGGSTAAPVFQEIMTFTLARFGVLPTGAKPPNLSIYP